MLCQPVHALRARGGPPGLVTMTLSQPSLAATMCMLPCRWPHPPPSIPPFLLMQNPHASVQKLSFLLSAQCDTHIIKPLGPWQRSGRQFGIRLRPLGKAGRQVGIRLRPLANAAYVACLPLLYQGSKWCNCKSVWLVFRRSWVWIPAGSRIFFPWIYFSLSQQKHH